MKETKFYLFNENGLIKSEDLERFCKTFEERTAFSFRKYRKSEIDSASSMFMKFAAPNLEFIIYDHGYVTKIEGSIVESIQLLRELDLILDRSLEYFVTPSQRVENSENCKYPRGASELTIAQFLDSQFNNDDYTSALKQS